MPYVNSYLGPHNGIHCYKGVHSGHVVRHTEYGDELDGVIPALSRTMRKSNCCSKRLRTVWKNLNSLLRAGITSAQVPCFKYSWLLCIHTHTPSAQQFAKGSFLTHQKESKAVLVSMLVHWATNCGHILCKRPCMSDSMKAQPTQPHPP